jgi:hypothetical protein
MIQVLFVYCGPWAVLQFNDLTMKREAPEELAPEDIAILLTLWHDLYDTRKADGKPRSSGMTREKLVEVLVAPEGEETTASRPFYTESALKAHLTGLKKLVNSDRDVHDHQMIRTYKTYAKSSGAKEAHRKGRHRDVYALAEGDLITWPTTAQLVLEVWNSDGHHIVETVLVERIEGRHLKRQPGAAPLTKEEISEDIDWVISRKYLDRYARNNLRGDGDQIRRLRYEIDYIGAIAAFCLAD